MSTTATTVTTTINNTTISTPTTATTLKSIGSVIRALVTSRKPPCKLREILSEYREIENKPLPFRSFGFNSVEELLRETGEFIFKNIGSETYISAKPNQKTAHIVSLVRGQKTSKSSRIIPIKEVRKPKAIIGERNSCNNNNNNNYYNYNNYHKAQQQQQQYRQQQQNRQQQPNKSPHQQQQPNKSPQPQPNKSSQQQKQSPQQSQQLKQQPQKQQPQKQPQQQQQPAKQSQSQQQQQPLKQTQPQPPQNNTEKKKPLLAQPKDLRDVLNQKVKVQQPNMANEGKTPRPILGQNNSTAHQSQQNHVSSEQHQMLSSKSQAHQKNQHVVNASTSSTAGSTGAYLTKGGIQNRLRLTTQNSDIPSSTINNTTVNGGLNARLQDLLQQKTNSAQKVQARSPPPFFHYNAKKDPMRSLMEYAFERGMPEPEFSSLKSKYSGQYQCRVEVNGSIYSTYPNEYTTEISARIACAQKAIEQIRLQEQRRPLPPCMDTDKQLIAKIYQEMLSHPSGVFAKKLPEWYESIFQQSLPEHWWSLVELSNKFTIEEGVRKSLIVFANTDMIDKDDPVSNTIQMEPIKLPWTQRFWDLYITYCASTVEIWARLIGKQYSSCFDQLLADIETHMEVEKSRPISIACKSMYLVNQSDCWHRVCVEEVDKTEGKALCFYIDFGDVNWVAVDQLYICEPRFLQLPAQAVVFSLFGLEDFGDNPNAREHLDKLLTGKSLVGEVFTKEADFAGICIVFLHDTNSAKDVQLNPLIVEEICNNTAPPELDGKMENVVVTHVNNDGDVYLQLMNDPGWKYVQKLIQQVIASKFNRDQHQVTRDELWHSKRLFLICDDGNSNTSGNNGITGNKNDRSNNINADSSNNVSWYRGVLSTSNYTKKYIHGGNENPQQQEFDIYYVDFGETRRISLSNIFRLEQLSAALSKYPAQAIKVRLQDIPDITPSIVGRMRALLPPNCEAMVKRKSPKTVNIYRRFDTLCLINETIRVEHELSVSSADSVDGSNKDVLEMLPNPIDNVNGKVHNGNISGNGAGGGGGSTPTTPTKSVGKPFIDLARGLTIVNALPDSPQKNSEMPKLKDYHAIPTLGEFFEVRVTMSANPSNFTIQPYKDYPSLRALMKELQDYCETNDEFIPVDMVERGQAYAAKNPDGFFHRVTVVDKYMNDMIHICYCDFGDIAILSNAQLKTLPARFRQLPKMALQAKLYGIAARNGDWTLDDCLRFRELTVGLKFVSTIKKISYDTFATPKTQILEMELIDVTTDEDVFIHEQLLKENRAIKIAES